MFLTNITCIDIDVLYCLVKPQRRATNPRVTCYIANVKRKGNILLSCSAGRPDGDKAGYA